MEYFLYLPNKMSYLLLTIYLLIICFVIYKAEFFRSQTVNPLWVIGIFLSKFTVGIMLWAIYAYFYEGRNTGDIFKYFDDGNIIYSALRENPMDYLRMVTGINCNDAALLKYYDTCNFWLKSFNYGLINDNRIVIRFNAIVRLISMGNIHIHTLIMSFLSFTGLWAIFKVFEKRINIKPFWIIAAIFFFPSVLFWTSGLLKEGILMFGFGLFFYFGNQLVYERINAKTVILFLLMTFILLLSKFYVLIASLPASFFLFSTRGLKNIPLFIKYIGIHLIIILMFWFSKPLTGLDFPQIIAQKQNDFIVFINSLNKVGSAVALTPLEPNLKSIITNLPTALYHSFFRPTIFEAKNLFMMMAAFENLIIIFLLMASIIFFNKKSIKEPLLWFNISFIFILFILIGLTTPVLGALVRYKAPALPFLGITFLYIIDKHKIAKTTNKRFND